MANQVVVLHDADGEFLFVLEIKNYNGALEFDHALTIITNSYSDIEMEVDIDFDDFILQELTRAGYEYKGIDFEEFVV